MGIIVILIYREEAMYSIREEISQGPSYRPLLWKHKKNLYLPVEKLLLDLDFIYRAYHFQGSLSNSKAELHLLQLYQQL